jgi:translocation and assembly module TamB
VGRSARVRIAHASILDPEGRTVIAADGIDARIDLARLVGSLVRGGPPEVMIDYAHIDNTEVALDNDAKGDLGIARAFESRPSTQPKKPAPAVPTEDVRLTINDAYVRHAWVHGNLVPPKLDGDGDELHAKLVIHDNKLNIDLREGRVTMRSPRGPGQSADVHMSAKGGLGMPISSSAELAMHFDLVGDAAGIPLTARVEIEKERLAAQVDIEPASADVIRRAFPASPLTRSVSLHAKAEGPLAKSLLISANGRVGETTVTVDGELGLRDQQPFHVDVELGRTDGAAFGGPASDVSGHVHAEGVIAGGAPRGTFNVATKQGSAAGQPIPAITAEGRFDAKRVDASFKAIEPGVDADGEITLRIPEQTLAFDVRARSRDLRSIARAPNLISGSATAHAKGTLDLASGTIAGRVTADGRSIARAPASAESVHVEATLAGPVADPVIDVTARATQVRLKAANATDKEPLTYPSATARAHIVLSPVVRLTDIEARVEPPPDGPGSSPQQPGPVASTNEPRTIVVKASEIRIDKGNVEVRGGTLAGLGGALEVTTQVGAGGAISLRAKGTDVDLGRVAAITGIRELKNLPEGSRGTLDVDLKTTAARSDGHVDVSVASKDGAIGGELHAKFENRHVSAHGRINAGALGVLQIRNAELELPGGLSASTIKHATGAVDLYGVIDLAQGAALFGGESIERISGTATLSARIERGDPNNMPTVFATARTQGLDLILNDEGKSTHIGGIDGSVHVAYDGATDDTEVAALTWDANGILASVDSASRVPLLAWATGAKPIDRAAIAALEVGGVIDIPRREVGHLPGSFARRDLRGALSARAEINGAIGRPKVTLIARAERMAERQRARGTLQQSYAPIDGVLEARWNGTQVVATLRVDEAERDESIRRGKRAADPTKPGKQDRDSGHVRGLVLGRLPIADLLAGRPPAWNASAEVSVTDLELTPLPLPMNLQGVLTGRLKVRDLAGTPTLEAKARVDELSLSRAKVGDAELDLDAKDGALTATASVKQDDGGSGRVKVISSSLAWHGGADVAWDVKKATRIEYALDRVSLGFVRPLVRQIMPEIEGRVDGSGSATVDATSQVFEGGIALTQGRFYVNAIGEDVTNATAVVRFERDGSFRIQDARAKIGAGELKASASGRMKGLQFESAQAVIVIPSKDGVPLASEGATFAQATGEIKLDAKMSPDRQRVLVTVAVPRAKVTVPDRGTQNLQSMEADKTITIGIRQADGTLARPQEPPGAMRRVDSAAAEAAAAAAEGMEPEKPVSMRFTVTLGNEVALEGRGLRLTLGGRTIVDIAQEVAVTGQISLKSGGTIDVQGRKFVVDRGTVTFVEGDDSADPIVIAAAYWDAPDRTRIWVEFSGPLKTGNLTLRSEPPYSKNEILSILLFGRADPNQGRAGDAKATGGDQAAAVGTGAAAAGLNKALGELDEDFELEQDRTSANRVRTKLGYRLRRTLKVQLAYASGFSQREPDTTYLFLEWQFIPKWSLIGTRGDRGTSILDVLFQHRY